MNEMILKGIQFLLAWFEVWMCYQFTAAVIPDCEYSRWKDKAVMWGNIIVLGSLMAVNRKMLFFSGAMFIFYIITTIICLMIVGVKRAYLVIFPYYTVVSLFDFFFAFMSMAILEQNFLQVVYYRTISVWKIIIFFCTRCIIGCIVWILSKIRIKEKIMILDFKNIIILLSVLSYIVLKRYQCIMAEMTYGDRDMKGYDAAFSLFFIILLVAFGLLFFYKYQVIQKEKEFLLSREEMAEQYYHDMGKNIESNRQFVHDVKNHFLALRGYDETGDTEGLHRYLTEISEEFLTETAGIKTGRRIIDIVLNQKRNDAEKMGTIFEFQVTSGLALPLKDSELCAVLGNLLDNSLEACAKIKDAQRWIRVIIEKQGKMAFIEVSNSIGEVPKQKNGRWVTSKADKNIHGYGLKSVQRIVDKYEGDFSCQIRESAFYAAVTFFDTERTS